MHNFLFILEYFIALYSKSELVPDPVITKSNSFTVFFLNFLIFPFRPKKISTAGPST